MKLKLDQIAGIAHNAEAHEKTSDTGGGAIPFTLWAAMNQDQKVESLARAKGKLESGVNDVTLDIWLQNKRDAGEVQRGEGAFESICISMRQFYDPD